MKFLHSTMAGELEWVFDSLVEFLRGPIWNIPVLTFIEQKSVVFEPGAENEDEFKKIHDAYKNLVDFMLGSYMEDLRITPDEFEKSCSVASKKALNQFHQSLFQQVWAADDFEIFKRMMTQKNLELQLQALEVLTQKHGFLPNCMDPNTINSENQEEENILEEIIKKVIEEPSEPPDTGESEITPVNEGLEEEKMRLEAEKEKEKELLEKAMKLTVKETNLDANGEDQASEDNLDNLPSEEENVKEPCDPPFEDISTEPENAPDSITPSAETADTQREKPQEIISITIPVPECLPPLKNSEPEEKIEKHLPPLKVPEERPWSEGDDIIYERGQVEVSPMELERRQNYLRQQRDRILALKKQERAKHLSNQEESGTTQARPRSARAARKIFRQESTEVDPQTLAFRKSLAARLRSEVVDKVD